MLCLVTQLCLTLCNPMACSQPGSSVHGDSPGKNTGVGCMPSSRGSSEPRDGTCVSYVSYIGRQVLYPLVPPGKPNFIDNNLQLGRLWNQEAAGVHELVFDHPECLHTVKGNRWRQNLSTFNNRSQLKDFWLLFSC